MTMRFFTVIEPMVSGEKRWGNCGCAITLASVTSITVFAYRLKAVQASRYRLEAIGKRRFPSAFSLQPVFVTAP
jgi:hypothetical protein